MLFRVLHREVATKHARLSRQPGVGVPDYTLLTQYMYAVFAHQYLLWAGYLGCWVRDRLAACKTSVGEGARRHHSQPREPDGCPPEALWEGTSFDKLPAIAPEAHFPRFYIPPADWLSQTHDLKGSRCDKNSPIRQHPVVVQGHQLVAGSRCKPKTHVADHDSKTLKEGRGQRAEQTRVLGCKLSNTKANQPSLKASAQSSLKLR